MLQLGAGLGLCLAVGFGASSQLLPGGLLGAFTSDAEVASAAGAPWKHLPCRNVCTRRCGGVCK